LKFVPFYIAKKYSLRLSKNSAINSITFIASFGVIAGALSLFVVLSVFSGLRAFSLSYTNATDPDYKIESKKGKKIILTDEIIKSLSKNKNIEFFSPAIEERALFRFKDKEIICTIKGVAPLSNTISDYTKYLLGGNWLEAESNEAVVGVGVCNKLSMGLFDFNNALEVYVPKPGKGLIENEQDAFVKKNLIPSGIFQVNEDLDQKYIFADINLVKELVGYKTNEYSTLELKCKNGTNETDLRSFLEKTFNNSIVIKNRAQLNDALYKMLNQENVVLYLIFTLVLIIALFNLIGAIIMMIIEKKQNLKTLYYLGLLPKQVRNVFLLQGNLISFFGGFIGLAFGIGIVFIQQQYHLVMITPTLAYPVAFEWENIVIVVFTFLSLGYIASKIASSVVTERFLKS
jgi:lipoprotein-releasing system permease protein